MYIYNIIYVYIYYIICVYIYIILYMPIKCLDCSKHYTKPPHFFPQSSEGNTIIIPIL